MKKLIPLIALVSIIICLQNCRGNERDTKVMVEDKGLNIQDSIIPGLVNPLSGIQFDSASIPAFLNSFPEFKEFKEDYLLFYRNRSFNYAWYDNRGLIESASVLMSHVDQSDTSYISYKAPYLDTLNSLIKFSDNTGQNSESLTNLNTELLLTGEYFNYAKKRWGQRLEGSPENLKWYIPNKKMDYADLLNQTLEGKDYDSIQNSIMNRYYVVLRKALNKYRIMERENPNPLETIKYAKNIKPGDSSSTLPVIRQRLHIFGFGENTNSDNTYEESLTPIVNKYKRSIGLKEDGIITKDVITALNVPIRKRIEQILVNLERMRWVPKIPEQGDMILVNIPEYMLHYFENGEKVWDCNVVVGKVMNKTVIFSGDIKNVIFSPYWYVPSSIIKKEIVPGMKKNPNYLASHRMEWNGGNVRQKPGPNNSLGQVKFIFPNSNNIYLHDTPSKNLFEREARAFSHGCVRVGKPRDLAIRILRNDPAWTPEKIDAAMNAGVEKWVPVKDPLPVYIGYFTAFVNADGELNFRDDVYNLDDRLFSLLAKDLNR